MEFIAYILIPIIVGFALRRLKKEPPPLVDTQGFYIMKLNKVFESIAWLGIIFFGLIYLIFILDMIFNFSWTKDPVSLGDILVPNLVSLFIIFVNSILMLLTKKYKVMLNETKIVFYGITGKVVEMHWKDIQKVTYSNKMSQFYLRDKTNRIYIDRNLSGFQRFVDTLKSKVNSDLTKSALETLSNSKR